MPLVALVVFFVFFIFYLLYFWFLQFSFCCFALLRYMISALLFSLQKARIYGTETDVRSVTLNLANFSEVAK